MADLIQEMEKAFDYRGDVTLKLKDDSELVGFLFNREARGALRCPEPFVEMMPADGTANRVIKYAEVASVAFTGEDTAAGKSWEEWMHKEEAKKLAAAKK